MARWHLCTSLGCCRHTNPCDSKHSRGSIVHLQSRLCRRHRPTDELERRRIESAGACTCVLLCAIRIRRPHFLTHARTLSLMQVGSLRTGACLACWQSREHLVTWISRPAGMAATRFVHVLAHSTFTHGVVCVCVLQWWLLDALQGRPGGSGARSLGGTPPSTV